VAVGDASHRNAEGRLPEREVQQRTRRDHREFRHVLSQPAKRPQHLGGGLDFVEEQQSAFRPDLDAKVDAQVRDGSPRSVAGEVVGQLGPSLEIHLDQGAAAGTGQFPDQPGLPNLASPAKNHGLARRLAKPVG